MMYRKIMPVIAVVGALTLTAGAGGCEPQDPCRFLAPPSEADKASAAGGSEVEREGTGNTECVVVGDRWSAEPVE